MSGNDMMLADSVRERYYSLDFLKCICAFIVVCIHFPFAGALNSIIGIFTSAAVPIFFTITGFFYERTVQRGGEIRQIKKIIIMLIGSNMIYLIWRFIIGIPIDASVVKVLLFNESPTETALWYFQAILYVLVFVYFVDKVSNRRYIYYILPILFVASLVLGTYSVFVFGEALEPFYTRNWIFRGLPFFCIGDILANNEMKLKSRFKNSVIPWIMTLFSLALMLIEKYIIDAVKPMGKELYAGLYVSTALIVVSVMILFLSFDNEKFAKIGCLKLGAVIGRKYSALIYIFHMLVGSCFAYVNVYFGKTFFPIELSYTYFRPIVVFIIALALSVVFEKLKGAAKNKIFGH